MNNDAFGRLYWSILDTSDTSSVQVADSNDDTSSPSGAYLSTHHIALEPATTTGASKLRCTAECLGAYESQWNDGFEEPAVGVENLEDAWDYFMIKTPDGSPLLVRDVVAQLHAWAANPFIGDKIRESMAWMYNSVIERGEDGSCVESIGGENDVDEVPKDTRIFFERLEEWGSDTDIPVVAVDFWVEGYDGKDAKYFWKSRIDDKNYPL
jgi:hypothetical protein